MRVRTIQVIIGVVAAVLFGTSLIASSTAATLDAQPLKVYLLRGGDVDSDDAVAATLRAAGFSVTIGPETPDFTGTASDLNAFDAVVMLYNQNIARPLNLDGVTGLVEYVRAGGGLISSEWVIWQSGEQQLDTFSAILPATNCGVRGTDQVTFRQFTPNPVINAGLPMQFSLTLDTLSGSEGCLTARPEAAILYGGSYPGQDLPVALAAWNPPEMSGRVASFSTLLSAAELASVEGRTLLQNTVTWISSGRDLTPPTIQSLTVRNAGTIGIVRDLSITVQAADRGGARLGSYYLAEYVYSGDPQKPWSVVQRSGWKPYGHGAQLTFDWQLTDDAGVHYLQLFVADTAGNATSTPQLDFISLLAEADSVAEEEVRIYRIRPEAGAVVQVQMQVLSGNPDLYVFGDDGTIFAEGLDTPTEEFTFTADGGVYQIEVEGYTQAEYRLSVSGAAPVEIDSIGVDSIGLDTRRRRSVITLSAYQPGATDAGISAPPAVVGPASIGRVVFMPVLNGE